MSTLISSQSEIMKARSEMELAEKRGRFMRSASIDRIMQFNLYICAQYYYPLPAIISWLKSSQTMLHAQFDRYITLFKTTFMFAIFSVHANMKRYLSTICCQKLQIVSVYLGVFAIFAQFLVCLYFMCNIYLPLGLIFQVGCISIISYVNVISSLFYLKTESKK
ncbi:hypothetical protein RI129_012982 [Pyrocoelia pectoralis]|uniref:Uncharacterized protein n=1 Tax=Pyrocoelia pectoralis TaxID=417401 RepID=A0AAN7ZCN5_9COLE